MAATAYGSKAQSKWHRLPEPRKIRPATDTAAAPPTRPAVGSTGCLRATLRPGILHLRGPLPRRERGRTLITIGEWLGAHSRVPLLSWSPPPRRTRREPFSVAGRPR